MSYTTTAELNADMRDSLLSCPKFREEAFAHEGTEAISEAADADVADVRKTVVLRYLDHLLFVRQTRMDETRDEADFRVLSGLCGEYVDARSMAA